MTAERIRRDGLKLQQGKCKLEIRKDLLTVRVQPWSSLPRQVGNLHPWMLLRAG